jgi:4'-phosphopantetheinyl transferase
MNGDVTEEFGGWERAKMSAALGVDELHVWRVAVRRSAVELERWRALLTEGERVRLGRFHFAEDAHRELVSKGAMRQLLGDYLGQPGSGIAFATEGRGKPVLAGIPAADRIEFNTSHSGEWVLLGFARGRPLGVDVERWREIDGAEIMRDHFAPEEIAAWSAVPAEARTQAFFHGWTRKEAYLKALGTGLMKPLASFRVRLTPGERAAVLGDDADERAAERWELLDVVMGPGYAGAVAVAKGIARVRWLELG